MLLPLPVRAAPTKTKPLPMEQLQVVQSFLHMVPQGRRMVEEVSEGAGQGAGGGAVEGHSLPSLGDLFLPCPLLPFPASHSLSPSLLFYLLPPFLGPAPSLLLSPLPCPGLWHQVDRAITACAELHDLKEVVLENQRELEGSPPETPAQVRHGELLLLPEPGSLVWLGLLTGPLQTGFS